MNRRRCQKFLIAPKFYSLIQNNFGENSRQNFVMREQTLEWLIHTGRVIP